MSDLLARVEAATGPDRALDLALAQALVPDVIVMRQRDDDSGADPYTHWQFTGSIDAALALVEFMMPNAMWSIRTGMEGGYAADLPFVKLRDMHPSPALHRTAPLAILAALLKAMAANTLTLKQERNGE